MNTWPWYRLCTTVASTKCGIAVLDEGDLRTAWPIRSVIFPGRSDIYPFRPVGYNFISQQNITSVFLNDRSSLAGLHLTTHLQEDDELDAAIAVSMVENNPPYLTGKMPGKKHSLALWVFRYTFYFERAWRDSSPEGPALVTSDRCCVPPRPRWWRRLLWERWVWGSMQITCIFLPLI